MLKLARVSLVGLLVLLLGLDTVFAGRGRCRAVCVPCPTVCPCPVVAEVCGEVVATPVAPATPNTPATPEKGPATPQAGMGGGSSGDEDKTRESSRIVPAKDPIDLNPEPNPVKEPPAKPEEPKVEVPADPAPEPKPEPKPALPEKRVPQPEPIDELPANPAKPKPAVDPADEVDPFAPKKVDPAPEPKAEPKVAPEPKPEPAEDDPFAPKKPAEPKVEEPAPEKAPPAEPVKEEPKNPKPPVDDDDPFKAVTNDLPMRRWVDITGEFEVQARLVELLPGKARLLKENGKTTTVPLELLSTIDADYVAQIQTRLGANFVGRLVQK